MTKLIFYRNELVFDIIQDYVYEHLGEYLNYFNPKKYETLTLNVTDNLKIQLYRSNIDQEIIVIIDELQLSLLLLKITYE